MVEDSRQIVGFVSHSALSRSLLRRLIRPHASTEGEWIEMKRDFLRRTTLKVSEVIEEDSTLKFDGGAQRAKEKGDRVILYVHGGAYFFSSLDTHRYQIQRHGKSPFSLSSSTRGPPSILH